MDHRRNEQPREELGLDVLEMIDATCEEYRASVESGATLAIDDLVASLPNRARYPALEMLLALDVELRLDRGERPSWEDYGLLFPNTRTVVQEAIARGLVEAPLPEFAGRYQAKRILGRGSFGTVYLAYDRELDRDVAIKHLFTNEGKREGALDGEARNLAQLDHPNIVPVYDRGTAADGSTYIVSKYIRGEDLKTALTKRTFPTCLTVRIITSIADALECAHRKGIIHRDVKPSNILIGENDNAYLTDFGIALRDEEFGEGASIAGSPAYMSPEQAQSRSHLVDGRSDIYSLAIVLYEMLSGRPLFTAESDESVLDRVVKQAPRPLRQRGEGIPRSLEAACLKALAKEPSERHATARDFAKALRSSVTESKNVSRGWMLSLGCLAVLFAFGLGFRFLISRANPKEASESMSSSVENSAPRDERIPIDKLRGGLDKLGRNQQNGLGLSEQTDGVTNPTPVFYDRIFSLGVAIDHCPPPSVERRAGAEGATAALAEVLATQYGCETTLLLGSDATKPKLLAELKNCDQTLGDNDALIVHFCTGGGILEESKESLSPDAFVTLYGTSPSADSTPPSERKDESLLGLAELVALLSELSVGHVLDVYSAVCDPVVSCRPCNCRSAERRERCSHRS